jgi:hypothetical protein
MTNSNVSTAVKIVVSMVVVAALVATRFSSKVRRFRRNVVYGCANRTDCVSSVFVADAFRNVTVQESALFECCSPFSSSPSMVLLLLLDDSKLTGVCCDEGSRPQGIQKASGLWRYLHCNCHYRRFGQLCERSLECKAPNVHHGHALFDHSWCNWNCLD